MGPFLVADASYGEVVARLGAPRRTALVAYALHVGGLNSARSRAYVEAMARADIVYADGFAVVLLARLAGARAIQRAPTTDLGHDVLKLRRTQSGTKPTVAIIGGPPGLAERAARALDEYANTTLCVSGYEEDYQGVFQRLAHLNPDFIIVGMGMPKEALWVDQHRDLLGNAVILTCGGWLGFLAGDERRAPRWMQAWAMEWLYRLMQRPRRLFVRYGVGFVTVLRLALGQFGRRVFR